MRLNIKLVVAVCCMLAGIIILWRTFGNPNASQVLPIRPTIAIVAEPATRPTLLVPTQEPSRVVADQPTLASEQATQPSLGSTSSAIPTTPIVLPTAASLPTTTLVNSPVVAVVTAVPPTLSTAPTLQPTSPATVLPTVQTLPTATIVPATAVPTAVPTIVQSPSATPTVGSTATPSATASATATTSVVAATATSTPESGTVTLTIRVEVTGVSVPLAEISYTIGTVRYAIGKQATPWSLTIAVDRSQPVLVQSRNVSDSGTHRCSITLEGQSTPANTNESDDPEILLECSVFDEE